MRKNIIFAAIVALLAAVAVPSRAEEPEDDSKMNLNAIARSIELYCNVYKELNFNYVDTIDNKKAAETAINAMLREIDPYTEFIPDRDTEAFFTHSSGARRRCAHLQPLRGESGCQIGIEGGRQDFENRR